MKFFSFLFLYSGLTRLGTSEANVPQDIQLSGSHILKEHCTFENRSNVVTLIPHKDALVYLNGRKLVEPEILTTGSRVILGKNHVFRFTHPEQAREIREKAVNEIPECKNETVDWNFAKCELLEKQGIDLKVEMQKRLIALEEQFKREKLQADQEFEEQRKVSCNVQSLKKIENTFTKPQNNAYLTCVNLDNIDSKDAKKLIVPFQSKYCKNWAIKSYYSEIKNIGNARPIYFGMV